MGSISVLQLRKVFPHSIILYANFIAPIIAGNTYGRILKMFTYNQTTHKTLFYEPENLEYEKVEDAILSNLHFELRSSSGQIIPFQDVGTSINIVFRRIIV